MTHREPVPQYTVVNTGEYVENLEDSVSVEDVQASSEVYVFYARIQKVSRFAIRAHVSATVGEHREGGIRYAGSVTFRDMDFSPAKPSYEFPGIFHAKFFVPDSSTPILVRPGRAIKKPLEMGFLVREDDGYEDELLAEIALPSLDRDS